jgi:hypothetical protein
MSYSEANQSRQSFNLVTQQDSRVMWQDNQTMKAVALITLLFLPMATVAVSTTAPPSSPTSLRIFALPTEDHLYRLKVISLNPTDIFRMPVLRSRLKHLTAYFPSIASDLDLRRYVRRCNGPDVPHVENGSVWRGKIHECSTSGYQWSSE